MTTPQTETTKDIATKRQRKRTSVQAFVHALKAEAPDLFQPWDAAAIRDAMIEEGMPRSALEDVLDVWLGLNRRLLDPQFQAKRTKTPEERAQAAKAAAVEVNRLTNVARSAVLRAVTADTMIDGRRLGDMTIGEVRTLGGVFAFILKRAGKGDDSRKVDDVMRKADWKRAA